MDDRRRLLGFQRVPFSADQARRYGLAVVTVAAAALLQKALWSTLPPSPQLFFYPAVFLVARAAGLGPALLTVGLSLPIMVHWFLPPYDRLAVESADDLLDLVLFATMAVMLAVLTDRVIRSETKARVAIEAAPFPTALLSPEGGVLYANPAFCKALDLPDGLPPATRIGSVVDSADHAAFEAILTNLAATDEPRRATTRDGAFACRARRADGRTISIEGRLSPIRRSRPKRLLMQFQDVTARKLAEADHERALSELREVVDQCPVGMVILRKGGNVLDANSTGMALLGRKMTEPSDDGTTLDREGHPLPLERWPSARALRGERVTGLELQIRRPDGVLVPLLVNAAPLASGREEEPSAVVVFQDISPLKELERLRAQWNAVVAHDLRQPIHSILLRTDHLARTSRAPEKDVQALFRATRRLSAMVQDLLDASSLEIHKLPLACREVDLVELVRDRVEVAREGEPARALELDVREPRLVAFADPDRITQILDNLLSNALKYGSRSAPIRIQTRAAGGDVVVSVSNEGEDIPEHELPLLFERFRRAESAVHKGIKGTGLGLYIVKELVLAHGGEITCTSERGTTAFRFTIPRSSLPQTASAPN